MRFGFFFFAEYVNVFIVSALTVTLFFGGWNAPFPWPWPIELSASTRARSGSGCCILVAIVPLVGTLVLAAPFWIAELADQGLAGAGRRVRPVQPVAVGARSSAVAYVGLDWVAGLLWFLGKTYVFVFTFVWMRGTLPRVRIDQLMGFAWKWLLPASLLNLFVTAAAIVVVEPP